MKRIVSLDAIRGIAILFMILSHAFVFGPFFPGQDSSGGATTTDVLLPGSPLEMTPPYFFFVTGISLSVSLYIRKRDRGQSLEQMARHALTRNVMLILIGTLVTPLLGLIGNSSIAFSDITRRIYGSLGEDVIAMLGYGNLIAFPLVFFLSWKTLVALATGVFVLVSVILQFQLYPNLPNLLTSLLITGDFAAFKTLPLVLLGGAVGMKLVERNRNLAKWAAAIGIITFACFLITLQFLGGGVGYGGGRKLYYFAFAMTVGFSFMSLGLFAWLENRGFKLVPITVIGRLALQVFIVHDIILGILYLLIPHFPNALLSIIYGFSVTGTVWAAAYLYTKRKWGKISDQYEPPPLSKASLP